MKHRTIAIIMVVAAFGGDFCLPASAQSSIGGVKKQTPLGAPVKQTPLRRPGETNFPWRPGEAQFHWRGKARSDRRTGEANLARRPGQQAWAGRRLSVPNIEMPCTLRGKRSTQARGIAHQAGGQQACPLQPDAAGENGLGEFGGGSAQGSARTEQNELDGAEIRQPVTARDLGKAGRDQVRRENRDA